MDDSIWPDHVFLRLLSQRAYPAVTHSAAKKETPKVWRELGRAHEVPRGKEEMGSWGNGRCQTQSQAVEI